MDKVVTDLDLAYVTMTMDLV